MSNIDRQRVAAVSKLEAMGYTFAAGDWMQPANDPTAVAPVITDALHTLLVARADAPMSCPEESVGACELQAITDALEPYEAVRWPTSRVDSGKGRARLRGLYTCLREMLVWRRRKGY
jgi:hypothetical protein